MSLTAFFTYPALLGLLVIPLVLALLMRRDSLRRLALHSQWGRNLTSGPVSRRRLGRFFLLIASLLLVIAVAGPRWGVGDAGVVSGRDVMVVLDLSKSMLAPDMAAANGERTRRWQVAQAELKQLITAIKKRGGHRVGLIVFASKPWVACPLTTDYDHVLLRVNEFTPEFPPPEINPEKDETVESGTRIGAALAEAVHWHDSRFGATNDQRGAQDILLLSDGDDPDAAGRDREIAEGVQAAVDARIPVYVVGLGDPDNADVFSFKRSELDEELIGPTRLVEEPLQRIADQTGGKYRSAQRDSPRLIDFFQEEIEKPWNRELDDDAVVQKRDRTAWFLLPAIVFLLAAWRWD